MLLLSLGALLTIGAPHLPTTGGNDYPFLVLHASDANVEVTIQRVIDYIEEELPPVNVAATVNHSAAAAGVGLELRATTVTIFGNPALGTLFMQSNQEHGLDLPLKLLSWEDSEGRVMLAYTDPDYLALRYGVTDRAEEYETMRATLERLCVVGSGGVGGPTPVSSPIPDGAGLLRKVSPHSVDTTIDRLEAALESTPVSVVTRVDHAAAAAAAGLELRPTTLLTFGNPSLGTIPMQERQTVGIDLPLAALAYEGADGQVTLVYNDLSVQLVTRHELVGSGETVSAMMAALETLTDAAVAPALHVV
jgi:uncharacterized protein (DUF302 family)